MPLKRVILIPGIENRVFRNSKLQNVLVGILDFKMGNLRSVANAVYESGFDYQFISCPSEIDKVSHLILPGVGYFSTAMEHLAQQDLIQAVKNFVMEEKKPTLGICLGFQLLSDFSEEGDCSGLGLIAGTVKKFKVDDKIIPHTGWNSVLFTTEHPVLAGIKPDRDFYFVHSYYFVTSDTSSQLCMTDYGERFCSGVFLDNLIGFQFHPEKSQNNGLKIIENFCRWDGKC